MVSPGRCKRKMGAVAVGDFMAQETRQRAGVNGKRWATSIRG